MLMYAYSTLRFFTFSHLVLDQNFSFLEGYELIKCCGLVVWRFKIGTVVTWNLLALNIGAGNEI